MLTLNIHLLDVWPIFIINKAQGLFTPCSDVVHFHCPKWFYTCQGTCISGSIVQNCYKWKNWPKLTLMHCMWGNVVVPSIKEAKNWWGSYHFHCPSCETFSVPWKSSIKDQNQELVFQRCMSTLYHKCIDWTDKKAIPWKQKFQNDSIYSRILLKE